MVAVSLHWRRQLALGLPLLRLVLPDQTPYERIHLGTPIFQLQLPRLYGLWVTDGHCGFSDCVCFCEAYLWVSGFFLQSDPREHTENI